MATCYGFITVLATFCCVLFCCFVQNMYHIIARTLLASTTLTRNKKAYTYVYVFMVGICTS